MSEVGEMVKLNAVIKIHDWAKLLISIVIAEGVGFLSGLLIMGYTDLYQNLQKPFFAPPGWLFGVVWPILYLLMGIAAYRIWRLGIEKTEVKEALKFYGIQLVLNFLWSPIYFRFGQRGLALVVLFILLILILLTFSKFYQLDRVAGYLLIPYLIWVGFALLLNYETWQLNRISRLDGG